MPSLRQKVTTYFRQLSFIAEPRDSPRGSRKAEEDDGNFITKYLEGRMDRIFIAGPDIQSSPNPSEMPDLQIATYATGLSAITAACTGPDEGLTGIKRSKLHLSASFADDIDFIDTMPDNECLEVRKSMGNATTASAANATHNRKFSNRSIGGTQRKGNASSNTASSTCDQNKNFGGMRSRKNSRTSISNLAQAKDNAKATPTTAKEDKSNKSTTIVVSMVSTKTTPLPAAIEKSLSSNNEAANDQNNRNIINTNGSNTKTEALKSKSSNEDASTSSAKLMDDSTERLLREAVSNQNQMEDLHLFDSAVAGVSNWRMETDFAYGISVSLYENNMLTKESMGNPIADCYGAVVRGDAAAMALADGVNWGDGARLAARSAVHGCLDYLDRAIFGTSKAATTQDVFLGLLRSLWEGHGCILEVGGALSTLTIAVVLPICDSAAFGKDRYVVCACNVGDSLGYVYSKKHGVREFTQASHDISSMRDMRDALGALGPADGNKPELSNLTFSMTIIERGDIVFLTSDGISDNFDPVVGKFAEAWTPDVKLMNSSIAKPSSGGLAPKRENKSASAIYARLHRNDAKSSPVAQPPVRPPRTKKSTSPEADASKNAPSRPKYMRSHTVIEPRRLSSAGTNKPAAQLSSPQTIIRIPKSISGLPLVTGPQRHALTLHRLEDLLSYGINGTFSPCVSARRLCHLLIDFVRMITSARRKTLEQRELFYKLSTGHDGVRREVELTRIQHRVARKRVIDSSAFVALPGKLDHATVVAYTVGGVSPNDAMAQVNANNLPQEPAGSLSETKSRGIAPLQSTEFKETNF